MVREFEPGRALEVIQPKYGSAYRIGGRLVLTAAHLLSEVDSSCRVRSKPSFGEIEARVVWKASQADIALIELPESVEPCEAAVFGLLPETRRGEKLKFQMYGYPRWGWTIREQGLAAGGRQVEGIIYLADTSSDSLLVVEALRHPGGSLDPDSAWRGYSGAAIVCDGLVIAVQQWHQNPERPESLEASPLWVIYSDGQWCNFLREHDINPEPVLVRVQERTLERKSLIGYPGLTDDRELQRDWGDAPENDVFFGRTEQLTTLKRWLVDERCRSISILGIGGIGKTALAKQLSDAVEGEFDYVIWRSLRDAPSVEKILEDLIQLVSDHKEICLSENLSEKIGSLIKTYLRSSRCLIILDNVEFVMERGNSAGHYKKGYQGYRLLFNAIGTQDHQSCLLLTSRVNPQNIKNLSGTDKFVRLLELKGLTFEEANQIFVNAGVEGSKGRVISF